MDEFIVHALLKQGEEPSPRACPVFDTGLKTLGIARSFPILDRVLKRKASRRDPPRRSQKVKSE